MACENCKCETTMDSLAKVAKEVMAINRFLDHKFHNDLYYSATCGGWAAEQDSKKEREWARSQEISRLLAEGYKVIEP